MLRLIRVIGAVGRSPEDVPVRTMVITDAVC
jgi:hypothetical protein